MWKKWWTYVQSIKHELACSMWSDIFELSWKHTCNIWKQPLKYNDFQMSSDMCCILLSELRELFKKWLPLHFSRKLQSRSNIKALYLNCIVHALKCKFFEIKNIVAESMYYLYHNIFATRLKCAVAVYVKEMLNIWAIYQTWVSLFHVEQHLWTVDENILVTFESNRWNKQAQRAFQEIRSAIRI